MARIPERSRNTGISGGTPRVQYATTPATARNAGEAAFTLSNVLRGISSRIEDRLDIQAEAEALREGAVAGGRERLPTLQDEATIRGRAFNRAARDAVAVRIDLQGRQRLNDLEQENPANPQGFRQKADAYLQGALADLQSFDPALAQRYEAEYKLRADASESRIMERHRAVVRDRQLEDAMRYQLALQDEISADAARLFEGHPADAQQTLMRMISNAGYMVDTANQFGPDGQPLFSARERIAFERQAEQAVAENVGIAWMRRQDDMLGAFKAWQDGSAEIELAGDDGSKTTINLREMLGERGYQLAGEKFMDTLRSELALQSQIEAVNDRAFKQSSDALYADLSVVAQEGRLSLNIVEASRAQLEPERYLALRELAKSGGASVSDGTVFSDLAVADADGQDIRAQLRQAYRDGSLSRDDYLRLYDRNSQRIDQGTKDPVRTGRDYLTQSLGVLSKEIGLAQSAGIGQAEAEYEIAVDDFIAKNERQPTHAEAREIAEGIRGRYSILSAADSLLSLPLPRTITQAEKFSRSFSSAAIEQKIQKTNQFFLDKHGGANAPMAQAARDADPDYIAEIRLLKQYYDLLRVKELENAGSGDR